MASLSNAASATPWINTSALSAWRKASSSFLKMGQPANVYKAAAAASAPLIAGASEIVSTEPDLQKFSHLADSFSVLASKGNVFVGVPSDHVDGEDARSMAKLYPVLDVATAENQEEIVQRFESALQSGT